MYYPESQGPDMNKRGRVRRTVPRYANTYRCECGQEWEVYCTSQKATSTCPECDELRYVMRCYDMARHHRRR